MVPFSLLSLARLNALSLGGLDHTLLRRVSKDRFRSFPIDPFDQLKSILVDFFETNFTIESGRFSEPKDYSEPAQIFVNILAGAKTIW